MIYIVIPVFNRWHYTKDCLFSLQTQTYKKFKIIVVDHGSTDGTSKNINAEFPEVIVLKGDQSMWWAAATNVGVKYALASNADYLLTLNNDLVVNSDYLKNIIDATIHNTKAIIGSLSADKKDYNRIVFTGTKWNKWTAKYRPSVEILNLPNYCKANKFIKSDLLPGRGTLIPVKAFKDVGLFDDENFPHYAADEYFSFICRKSGYDLIIPTNVIVYSEVEATGLKNERYSRNLTLWKEMFTSIRSPLNLKYRWIWAVKCSPLPPIYFFIDLCRIIFSQIKIIR